MSMKKTLTAVTVSAAILALTGCQATEQGPQATNQTPQTNQSASLTISQPGGTNTAVGESQQNGLSTTPFTGMQFPNMSTQQFLTAPEYKPLPIPPSGATQQQQTQKPPEFKPLSSIPGTTEQNQDPNKAPVPPTQPGNAASN